MNAVKYGSVSLVMGLTVLGQLGAQAVKPSDIDATVEFKKLAAEFDAAVRQYYKAAQDAKGEEEQAKAFAALDPAKAPDRVWITRIKEFAKQHRGTEGGLDACQWIVRKPIGYGGGNMDWLGVPVRWALDELTTAYVGSDRLTKVLAYAQYIPRVMPKKEVLAGLAKIEEESPHARVKSKALLCSAQILTKAEYKPNAEELDEGVKLFERVVAAGAETPAGVAAAAELFEMRYLQVGKAAPDIEGTDPDGKAFKLSDYRGKVVLLDFWGFW